MVTATGTILNFKLTSLSYFSYLFVILLYNSVQQEEKSDDKNMRPPAQRAPLPPTKQATIGSSNDIRRIQSTSGKLYKQSEQEPLQRKVSSSLKRANTFGSPGTVDEAGYTEVMSMSLSHYKQEMKTFCARPYESHCCSLYCCR